MKNIYPVTLLVLAHTVLCSAMAAWEADTEISAVSVFSDRAVVTRTGTAELRSPGVVEITVANLPGTLVDDSVQAAVNGSASVTLVDVTSRVTYVPFAANDRVKEAEDRLQSLAHEDRVLKDRSAVLGHQREFVLRIQNATTSPAKDGATTPMSSDMWTKLLAMADEQLSRIDAELQGIDAKREELAARKSALERQVAELRGHEPRKLKTVFLRLNVAEPGRVALTLKYMVFGASWSPRYDARLSSDDAALKLGYYGYVRQNTGEDWTNVELTLSTANPALGGVAPELTPWVLSAEERVQLEREAKMMEGRRMKAEMPVLAMAMTGAGSSAGETVAVVENRRTSATFRIPLKTDLVSDNAPHRVAIANIALRPALSHATTPKLIESAYLSASVVNTSEYPLLSGTLNVFLDGTFLATTPFRAVMPGERFDLALGADEGISVKRRLINRFAEETGLITAGKRITYDVKLTLQNNKRTDARITVIDQIPVSRSGSVAVSVLSPDPSDAKPDASGLLKWQLLLKPGEKRELSLKVRVEHPADMVVAGLE